MANKSRYSPEELGAIFTILDSAMQLTRLSVVDLDTEIRLSRAATGAFADSASAPATTARLPVPNQGGRHQASPPAPITLRSPAVGTFRRSNAGAEPFVTVGTSVGPGSVIGNIEIIRDMMGLPAATTGIVTAILVDDGEPIEFGQPLMTIEPLG